jgi:hypothetical protein
MHYQPEESTIPRGGIFAQQLNALLRLRSLLPGDVGILVKENKATFRAPLVLAMSARNEEFYRAIASLPETLLVPLEYDTFDLIDRSLAVATITGSVGLEALCRGRKVITFGEANYRGFRGVTHIDPHGHDDAELRGILADPAHDPSLTQADLLQELPHSFGPAVEDSRRNVQSQQAATIEAFEYIARHLGRFTSAVQQ